MEGDNSNVTNKIGSDVKKAMEKAKTYMKSTYNIEVKEVKIISKSEFLFSFIFKT